MNPTHIIHLKETESTNSYAKALLSSGEPFTPYTLIYTDNQTNGRGRLSRIWESQKGDSLCMSLIVPFPNNPCVTLIAAMGVYNVLRDICDNTLLIKWPNDLVAGNKKLCGILTESTQEAAIIGIGVNLNNTEFSENIRHKATSLKILTNKNFAPLDLAEKIAASVRNLLETTQGTLTPDFLKTYTNLCANIGKEVHFSGQTGLAIGIGENGALMVNTHEGIKSVTSGEVAVSGIY